MQILFSNIYFHHLKIYLVTYSFYFKYMLFKLNVYTVHIGQINAT